MPGFDEPFVASGASHAGGTVPDPGATAGTENFLREDATWAVPPATGGGGGIDSVTVTDDATSIAATTITVVGAVVSGTAPDAIVTIGSSAPTATIHALGTELPLDTTVWTAVLFFAPAAGTYLVFAALDIINSSITLESVAVRLRNGETVIASGESSITPGGASSLALPPVPATFDGTAQVVLEAYAPAAGFQALAETLQQAQAPASAITLLLL